MDLTHSDAESLQPEQAQQVLFPEHERDLLQLDDAATRKRYTAVSLERQVAKRDAIVRALAEGHGLLRIARAFGVSHHTVRALRDSRPDLVAIEKKQLSAQIGAVVKMSLDSMVERLEKGTWKPGSVDLGILLDKKALLDGEASLIVEHRHVLEASPDGFRERLKKVAGVTVDCESIVTPQNAQCLQGVSQDDTVCDTTAAADLGKAVVVADGVRALAGDAGNAGRADGTPGGGMPAGTAAVQPDGSIEAEKSTKGVL